MAQTHLTLRLFEDPETPCACYADDKLPTSDGPTLYGWEYSVGTDCGGGWELTYVYSGICTDDVRGNYTIAECKREDK